MEKTDEGAADKPAGDLDHQLRVIRSAAEEKAAPEQPGLEKKFTQADLDAIVQDRVARAKAAQDKRFADYDELKNKAGDYERLQRERESETEKAIREAREQARTEAIAEWQPRLVLAEMRAVAAGRIEPDRLDELTDDIDLARYVKDGQVDAERVRRKVDAWAPPKVDPAPGETQPPSNEPAPRKPRPDHTQGAGRAGAFGADRGLAEAERRFGSKTKTP